MHHARTKSPGSILALSSRRQPSPGFTLIELLVTITIIGILSSTVMFALFGAQEEAKSMKTKSMITKLNNLVMPRYESFRTRRVPVQATFTTVNDSNGKPVNVVDAASTAKNRLDFLRRMMKYELPDRWNDLEDAKLDIAANLPVPSVTQAYVRAYNAIPSVTGEYANAECLYLIVTLGQTDELGGRELFNESNVGDVDNDGAREFLDAWGMPIMFLRWAPGFGSELNRTASGVATAASSSSITGGTSLLQTADAYKGLTLLMTTGAAAGQAALITGYTPNGTGGQFTLSTSPGLMGTPAVGDQFNILDRDPFDSRHIYPSGTQNQPTFALYPLIYSSGPDRTRGVASEFSGTGLDYRLVNDNPFVADGGGQLIGTEADSTGEKSTNQNWVTNGWLDNIHNHLIGTK